VGHKKFFLIPSTTIISSFIFQPTYFLKKENLILIYYCYKVLMLDKLAQIADRFEELTALLSEPETANDSRKLQEISKEQAKLAPIAGIFHRIVGMEQEFDDNFEMSKDPNEDSEMRDMANEEVQRLKKEIEEAKKEANVLLLPKDPNDTKNTILEIRAGTGGDEAALFVSDMFKMYRKFADLNRWKTEIMDSNPTGIGGFKEIVVSIEGTNVFSRMKYEAGTHRVQRVPDTETQGRVHTSAVTVAILPEADDIEVDINVSDLRVDTYRSQGAGGQHVNTTDSAVRITHVPTNVVVACQEERSQTKNKAKAMKLLRAKLFEIQEDAVASEEAQMRKGMVGSGDRSERIRTYNYPQGRITDHRIGLTLYKLEDMMSTGDINEVVDNLAAHAQIELLKKANLS
jgi:peptide chain release factor 1